MSNLTKHNKNMKNLAVVAIVAVTLIILVFGQRFTGGQEKDSQDGTANVATQVKDNDIVIQVKDISQHITIYPANINGTDMEVIAVKASDGTIRTAFNTCQVCYDSGRGYYKEEGNKLVCQNCGNRFSMDDVEVTKGGCNPVPITEEYKTVTEDTITISKEVLSQASQIFANWK